MGNRIIIKNGEGTPENGVLLASELGFDFKNKRLYIGLENGESESAESYCLNQDVIKKSDIEFNTKQNYKEILEEGIT